MFRKQRSFRFIMVLVVLGASQLVFGVYQVGAIADNFTVKVHGTNTDASLYDYAEHIIVLDFWAHWCGPCRVAASELEPYIQQYYDDLGGNPAGIPVQLISLNIQGGATAETNAYIAQYGLETVWDDTSHVAYNPFSTGGIPLFAIINGVAGANYDQWEILYNDAGYASGMYESFRSDIDSVVPEPCSLALLGLGGLLIRKRR